MSEIGRRVRQAREFRGITQTELAERVGIKQPAVAQIEAGFTMPRDEHLELIALATGFPVSFFRIPAGADFPLPSHLHARARKSLSAPERKQAYRYAEIAFEIIRGVIPRVNLPPVRLAEVGSDPGYAAEQVRATFGLSPDSPIPSLIRECERNGVLVFSLPLPDECDAFSCWVEADVRRPAIFLGRGRMGDRQNWTLAHELGHLVLHQARHDGDLEGEADGFAAELLLPEGAFLDDLGVSTVTLTSAGMLKRKWFVAMSAIIRRAHELGSVDRAQYKSLNIQINRLGWRKLEPNPIQPEPPRAIQRIIEAAYGPGETVSRLASDSRVTKATLEKLLGLVASAPARAPAVRGIVRR